MMGVGDLREARNELVSLKDAEGAKERISGRMITEMQLREAGLRAMT